MQNSTRRDFRPIQSTPDRLIHCFSSANKITKFCVVTGSASWPPGGRKSASLPRLVLVCTTGRNGSLAVGAATVEAVASRSPRLIEVPERHHRRESFYTPDGTCDGRKRPSLRKRPRITTGGVVLDCWNAADCPVRATRSTGARHSAPRASGRSTRSVSWWNDTRGARPGRERDRRQARHRAHATGHVEWIVRKVYARSGPVLTNPVRRWWLTRTRRVGPWRDSSDKVRCSLEAEDHGPEENEEEHCVVTGSASWPPGGRKSASLPRLVLVCTTGRNGSLAIGAATVEAVASRSPRLIEVPERHHRRESFYTPDGTCDGRKRPSLRKRPRITTGGVVLDCWNAADCPVRATRSTGARHSAPRASGRSTRSVSWWNDTRGARPGRERDRRQARHRAHATGHVEWIVRKVYARSGPVLTNPVRRWWLTRTRRVGPWRDSSDKVRCSLEAEDHGPEENEEEQ
ncbi:hypothetical protein CpipJ_CPIJ002163 [Culex quinquefasciatus]|uniref:Uncharacterized protein n=1 Tax=Culex quinquefasciatus TaxID=7176 RepID=B0W3Z7_CULQU|nr:hypothetical protein CpipJ_CPIJ002163 [Culex quinquefasciatus]|eukprot:XP_001843431.1 hypothetical protein CpipJ_CPIJ002163 [Culex quinquefasciatus]